MTADREAIDVVELMTRWEQSLYVSMSTALDLGFIIARTAGLKHGLARVDELQRATGLRDTVRDLSSAPALTAPHRAEIKERVTRLSSSLKALGTTSLRTVPAVENAVQMRRLYVVPRPVVASD